MKQKFIFIVLACFLLVGVVSAQNVYNNAINNAKEVSNQVQQRTEAQVQGETSQNQQQNQQQTQEQVQENIATSPSGVQTQQTTREATKNQGEEIKLRISNTIQNVVQLAQQIEKNNPGVGSQIMLAVQEQTQSMEKISASLDKVGKRNSVLIFLIGPNYKELNSAKSEIEKNKLMIQNMNQIMNQLQNESDRTLLQEQIQNLETEILDLETFINQISSRFSLFGWLIKLFQK